MLVIGMGMSGIRYLKAEAFGPGVQARPASSIARAKQCESNSCLYQHRRALAVLPV